MTAAQIREAARILHEYGLEDTDVVTFLELGSEGCVLRLNAFATPGTRSGSWRIYRDGVSEAQS